jgi:hypothetical protein
MKIALGAEPKKMAIAGLLLVVAAYMMYTNIIAGDPYATSSSQAPAPSATASAKGSARMPAELSEIDGESARPAPPRRATRGAQNLREWVPKIGGTRPEDRADPNTTDPRLRLDLLASLQKVTIAGGHRSLFDFSIEPVKVPDVKIVPGKGKPDFEKPPEVKPAIDVPKPGEDAGSAKAPPPPIPLKFYGYVAGSGGRRAFFLNGEDIFTAAEGQEIQKRYRIVRIGPTSAEVLDTQHDHKQTIPIEPEPSGG